MTTNACRLESVTPDDDALTVISPGAGRLIVDCELHGEIGSIPAGGNEGARLDEFWADHVAYPDPKGGRGNP